MEPEIVRSRLSPDALARRLVGAPAGEMVKVVVDVARKILALGGDLHADGEQLLLDDGSKQEDLWGATIYPGKEGEDQIECAALINIRPRQENRSMEIEDAERRRAVEHVIRAVVPLS